LYSLVTHFYYE